MAQVKRETASLCLISDLNQGSFVKAEGWNPSYFVTALGKLSRVNLFGVIVSKEQEGLILDDGSGRILLRSFEDNSFDKINVGEFVLVIGRPRMYNEQKYVLPEILKPADPAWAAFRQKELEILRAGIKEVPRENRLILNEPVVPTANYFQKIIDFIKDLDDGEGAPSDEVIRRADIPKGEELVLKLIEEGEIFELKPGRLKVLE